MSEKLPKGAFYEIPYRSLVAEEVPNMIVGGRCMSVSFILQASMRIQLTCMSIGEAAGIAAAWALADNIKANDIIWNKLPDSMCSYTSAGDTGKK